MVTQKIARVTDLTTRCSEIGARLTDVEQALHRMDRELNSVHKSGDIALGRNRNVLDHVKTEPFMKGWKQRERSVRYCVVNLRTAEIFEHVAIKGVFRLGRWQEVGDSGCRDPRQTLQKSANPWHRDRLLASADRILTVTRGE